MIRVTYIYFQIYLGFEYNGAYLIKIKRYL